LTEAVVGNQKTTELLNSRQSQICISSHH